MWWFSCCIKQEGKRTTLRIFLHSPQVLSVTGNQYSYFLFRVQQRRIVFTKRVTLPLISLNNKSIYTRQSHCFLFFCLLLFFVCFYFCLFLLLSSYQYKNLIEFSTWKMFASNIRQNPCTISFSLFSFNYENR